MPTLNLGRVGVVNKGAWADGLHKLNDVVTYLNGTYACILQHTSTAGDIVPTNATYWIEWVSPNVVHNTGDETIAGIKTFTSSPVLPTPADGDSSTKGATTAFVASAIPYNIHAATSKATPVDADELAIIDSAATFGLKKLTWANTKATLKTYFDTLYAATGIVKQLQTIDATVATSALTVTLNATTLDFRSTTLGSGTVNTRTVASPISLVVPSGATLGTINAVQSKLVLIAIDNAGTVELAITNISGGVNLNETTLISTTAITTGADSANVVYSTTARTNVPFRVVGYIDITEATAGTWDTAPSLIQGSGGQALTAMSSIGYGQTWQNLTGSRTGGTTYYNTTGKPIQVMIVNSSTNNVVTINGTSLAGANLTTNVCISFIVPDGQSYSVSGTFFAWSELR